MFRRSKKGPAVRRYSWRSLALLAGGAALLAGGGYWARVALLPSATAQPTVAPQSGSAHFGPASAGTVPAHLAAIDYTRRVVAYVWETEPVTRQDLGEYLIARHGPEKLPVLVNMRIIDHVCRQAGIEVTAAEVETAVADDLKGAPDQANVLKSLLARYRLNLEEWKSEVVRPRLQLGKFCRHEVRVSEEEIEQAYQSAHGPKVQCRVLVYPNTPEGKEAAMKAHAAVRNSDDEFDRHARSQPYPAYAAVGGKIKPFGLYTMEDPAIDHVVFRLKPGEVSEVLGTRDGWTIFKCERYVQADGITRESARATILKELTDKKINQRMQTLIPDLKKQATPRILLERPSRGAAPVVKGEQGPPRPDQVVAYYHETMPITREELGEYLIRCFGTDNVEFLVNHRIIEKEVRSRGITVTEQEVDAALHEDVMRLNATEEVFAKQFLDQYHKTLYEYREDAVRYRLALAKLCADRVRVTEEDLQMAYEAYHGEKLDCRIILWPADQKKWVLKQYPSIRDSEEAFADAAKHQASPTLASKGGRLDLFGRHTLGDENLEREAFRLKPGEVSTVVGTPQGDVVMKCDRRIPPDKVPLEKVRAELERDVRRRKIEREIQIAFHELQEKAQPKLLLRDPNRPKDIKAEVRKEIAELNEATKAGQVGSAGQH
jgi:parvulin-like peptidyl-prolyl isomerase